jgi:hypothetical protein
VVWESDGSTHRNQEVIVAGHWRTTDTGTARRTSSGHTRRVREHLPAGEALDAKRLKDYTGARKIVVDRLEKMKDPARRLDAAVQYVRSATAKYEIADVNAAVDALLALGDQIFAASAPLSEDIKRHRREAAARRRVEREQTQVMVREGKKAIRRQQRQSRAQPS